MDRRLLILALGMFALGTDNFVVAGILPMVARSMTAPVSLVGQMVTLYAISYAVLSPIMAAVTAHWPRKRLLLSGLAVFIIGNVATALAPTLTLLFVSRLVAGFGAAMFSPIATSVGASLVPPERRGRALAVVITGLTSATALGSPIGTALSGLGDWRTAMWFVAALGMASALGIGTMLPQVPSPPPVSLRQRLTPLTDSRVMLTLCTTLMMYSGLFIVYTYIALSFDRVTHGNSNLLAALLFAWGIAATAGNLVAGRLTDRFGSRRIINSAVLVAFINFVLLPWSSAYLATAVTALVIWGLCGWGMLVPQSTSAYRRRVSWEGLASLISIGTTLVHLALYSLSWRSAQRNSHTNALPGARRQPSPKSTNSSGDERGPSLNRRKAAGVEPTREWLTPSTEFEAQPHHQMRMPSLSNFLATFLNTPFPLQHLPQPAIPSQQMNITLKARISHTIEKLQHLNRPLTPEPGPIAKCRR
jgi:MFS transporter, DHA1 family, inner membrane transport protein